MSNVYNSLAQPTTTFYETIQSPSGGTLRVFRWRQGKRVHNTTIGTIQHPFLQRSTGGVTPTNISERPFSTRSPANAGNGVSAWTTPPTLSGNLLVFVSVGIRQEEIENWTPPRPNASLILDNAEQADAIGQTSQNTDASAHWDENILEVGATVRGRRPTRNGWWHFMRSGLDGVHSVSPAYDLKKPQRNHWAARVQNRWRTLVPPRGSIVLWFGAGGTNFTKSLSISVSNTASVARVAAYARALSINVSMTAAVARVATMARSLSISVTNTASVAELLAHIRGLSVNVSMTASVTRLATMGRALSFSVSNSATLARLVGFARALSISVANTASVARAQSLARSLSISVSNSAAASRALNFARSLSTSIGSSATLARIAAYARSLSSSITNTAAVGDVLTHGGGTNWPRAVASTISHAATVARQAAMGRALSSSISHGAALARTAGVARSLANLAAHNASVARIGAWRRALAGMISHIAGLVYTYVSSSAPYPVPLSLRPRPDALHTTAHDTSLASTATGTLHTTAHDTNLSVAGRDTDLSLE